MVQLFSPGFLACTQRFETRLTSGILSGAGMGWGLHDSSCVAGRFDSVPDLNLVVFDHDSSLNAEFEIVPYIVFRIVRVVTYQFLRRIQDVVDAREQKHKRGPTYLKSC